MQARYPEACILTCDTVIELDHHTLGKPKHQQEAFEMIRMMAGRQHLVHTGMMLCSPAPIRKLWRGYDFTRVSFNPMTNREIRDYVTRSNPLMYAGGYAIQKEGADLVDHITGRLDTVIGLSINQISEGLGILLNTPPLRPASPENNTSF